MKKKKTNERKQKRQLIKWPCMPFAQASMIKKDQAIQRMLSCMIIKLEEKVYPAPKAQYRRSICRLNLESHRVYAFGCKRCRREVERVFFQSEARFSQAILSLPVKTNFRWGLWCYFFAPREIISTQRFASFIETTATLLFFPSPPFRLWVIVIF